MKHPRHNILAAAVAILAAVLFYAFNRGERATSPANPSTASGGVSPAGSSRPPSPATPWSTVPAANPAEVIAADALLRGEGARTDATLAAFPALAYQRVSQPAGLPAGAPPGGASIHVPGSGLRVSLQPNQIGEFPEVPACLSETIGVRLSLPGVRAGTPVRVVLMDGGTFPAVEGAARVLEASKWGGVSFEFTTSANPGDHRVLVQAPGQRPRILDFNATPET